VILFSLGRIGCRRGWRRRLPGWCIWVWMPRGGRRVWRCWIGGPRGMRRLGIVFGRRSRLRGRGLGGPVRGMGRRRRWWRRSRMGRRRGWRRGMTRIVLIVWGRSGFWIRWCCGGRLVGGGTGGVGGRSFSRIGWGRGSLLWGRRCRLLRWGWCRGRGGRIGRWWRRLWRWWRCWCCWGCCCWCCSRVSRGWVSRRWRRRIRRRRRCRLRWCRRRRRRRARRRVRRLRLRRRLRRRRGRRMVVRGRTAARC